MSGFLTRATRPALSRNGIRDDEALLTHLDNIRDLYDQLLAIGEITRLQVFGNASEEVRAAHLQQREFYDYWSGITRVIVDTS